MYDFAKIPIYKGLNYIYLLKNHGRCIPYQNQGEIFESQFKPQQFVGNIVNRRGFINMHTSILSMN